MRARLTPIKLVAVLLALACAAAAAERKAQGDARLQKLVDREAQVNALLVAGKLAFESGDFSAAASNWGALLKVEGLAPDVEKVVRPLFAEARGRAKTHTPSLDELTPPGKPQPEPLEAPPPPKPASYTVSGSVSGGGGQGPGGAVITLRRTDGQTPRPPPLSKPLLQKDKRFVPHVVAVPVGSSVDFRNEDPIFHNVFSLSPAARFDTGLRKAGESAKVNLDKPGVVELFCNIHTAMLGFLVVVDTPWYAVADGGGAFQIKNVPPGEYDATVWHESASAPVKKHVTVAEATGPLSFSVGADKHANQFPPDKYGKPRQQQLGY